MVDVLAQVARRSVDVLGDWCSIYLLDEQEKLLRLAATYHVDDDELAPMRDLLLRRPVRLGEGIVGRVAERGEPVASLEVISIGARERQHGLRARSPPSRPRVASASAIPPGCGELWRSSR